MRQIAPLILKQKYFAGVEREINAMFDLLIYQPIRQIWGNFTGDEIFNAKDTALLTAIKDGNVWYENGAYRGTYNASISRELRELGATYDAKQKSWRIPQMYIPAQYKDAQLTADARYDAIRRNILETLADVDTNGVLRQSATKDSYEESLGLMDEDFQKTVKSISIPPNLTRTQKSVIAKDYATNLDLYIKTWADKNILELRQKVQTNAFGGRRAADLEKLLMANYGVSKRKAKFLARQETSLLMSKYRETKYLGMGLQRYRWSTSHDERVRHDHKELNNNIYSWSDPPVTNLATGARNHPGEDFNCRCLAIPIID